MNRISSFFSVSFIALASLSVASCSDDKDPQPSTISDIFPEGVPTSIGDAKISFNDNGQVTKMTDGSETITFEYGSFSPTRSSNFTVLMKVHDTDSNDSNCNFYLELNNQGFVKYAYQEYLNNSGKTSDTWNFEYNADGQLTRVRRSESGDDFKIKYRDGDIESVTQKDNDGTDRTFTFTYHNPISSYYPSNIANKGGIMLFDDAFHIDIDEMEMAYYAGILGKATKNLPIVNHETGIDDDGKEYSEIEFYNWEFNTTQLPVKFWISNDHDAVTFTWK